MGVSRIHRTGHVDEWRLTTVEETEDWPVMSPSDELDTTAHDMMQCICFRRGCRLGRKVEVLEVLRSFGDIFSQKLWLLQRKKTCKDGFD